MSEAAPPEAPAIAARRADLGRLEAQAWRYSGRIVLGLVVAFVLAWVAYKAVGDGQLFVLVGLNALTLAGLYFIVASGFSLIFGLMRVVNMAHGSFYMLGGFIAFEVVRSLSGGGATSGFTSTAGFGDWILGLVIASFVVGVIGLVMQQLFLRWNQGQELRQALITIAASIIIADQVLGHFGGIADEIPTPEQFPETVSVGVYGINYPFFRIFVLALAVFVGLSLWGMIKRTRLGMIIRAGVDDRPMVEALGINVPIVFAVTFFLGSLLAGMAGVLGGTMIVVDKANDVEYLLASLIVVIIGGMGSLGGAAVGALLYGLVDSYGDVYLPAGYENYSDLVIFALLVLVLAVRPHGLFGRPA
jgi:branched-chain amino acid transport system permease protein